MDFWYYVLRWLGGWCDIVDGLFRVLTLGYWHPMLSFKLVIYSSKRVCRILTKNVVTNSSARKQNAVKTAQERTE
jgi:hypothetical protein